MKSFFVAGVPVPKGSAKAFLHKKTSKIVTMQTNADKQKPWASAIGYAAQQRGFEVTDKPVLIIVDFIMPRPKSHYRTGKNSGLLRDTAPVKHTSTPDLDKLIRCVKDALTGIVWKDDSQVFHVGASKMYGDQPGASIRIKTYDEP